VFLRQNHDNAEYYIVLYRRSFQKHIPEYELKAFFVVVTFSS